MPSRKPKLLKNQPRLIFLIAIGAALLISLIWQNWPATKPIVKVYFLKGKKLVAVTRPLSAGENPLEKGLQQLLLGPNYQEKHQGLITLLPQKLAIRGCAIKEEMAIVDFSRDLTRLGGGSARLQGLLGQIVYTVTEAPGIKKVWIWQEGKRELVLGGEGLILDHPLGRGDLQFGD